MKLTESARELLDRFLLAVKRELTGKQQEDITAEIESYILDFLEERFSRTKQITEKQMAEILQEMGAPRKVAAQYSTSRYLIGPRLFPIYILVLKIVLAAVAGALTLSFIITTVIGESFLSWPAVFEYLGAIWSGALSAAGAVTIVFAIFERVSEGKEIEEIKELQELDISGLPELSAEEKEPGKAGLIIEIVLSIIGIAFFTYLTSTGGLVPYLVNPGSGLQHIRIFTDNFLRFIPLIIGLAGLDLARNITLLVLGYHSALSNWWQIGTQGTQTIMMLFMTRSLPLITFDALGKSGIANQDFIHLESIVNKGIMIALSLAIFGTIVDIIRKVIRELRSPST
jgi:hypothetical protein